MSAWRETKRRTLEKEERFRQGDGQGDVARFFRQIIKMKKEATSPNLHGVPYRIRILESR
jgi:hypothetical protein